MCSLIRIDTIKYKNHYNDNEMLNQLIVNIKNEIDESEKLRNEAKTLLDNSQKKLDSASDEANKITSALVWSGLGLSYLCHMA